ncbi:MAPEG family protein [Azospirillum cavernae]|uniref:MAPEG family protein n=1 Tax=Azospirillum cavernae TaxID=2320860 RepID=A0A418W478_9PROT|nr:MAPEG family protein [Azospirillum cavernae]RJF84757.1 MAPEG family protein [Azospirillum cavernae]
MADRSTILLKRAAMVNGGSAALTFAVLVVLAGRVPPPDSATSADRFVLWAGLALWPSLILFGMVGAVILARGLCRAFNPLTDAESPFQRVSQRVLSNSVEQTLIFLPALAALVALSPSADLGAARAVGLFALGRLLFWGGYLVHPFWRAPGMAMTLSTTLTVLGWAVFHALG